MKRLSKAEKRVAKAFLRGVTRVEDISGACLSSNGQVHRIMRIFEAEGFAINIAQAPPVAVFEWEITPLGIRELGNALLDRDGCMFGG